MAVNLTAEKASVEYGPGQVDGESLTRAIEELGYGVSLGEKILRIPLLAEGCCGSPNDFIHGPPLS